MGGGEALSFAARHRDPQAGWGTFAAVLDHSGSVGPMQQYFASCGEQPGNCNSNNLCQQWYEELYDTPTDYCTDPFVFQRAAIVDIPHGNAKDAEFEGNWKTSLASNLMQTPREVYRETQARANSHLQEQTQELIDLGPKTRTSCHS